MKNVVLIASLFAACGPLPGNPQTTEGTSDTSGQVTDNGTSASATEGMSVTSDNPTTEVNGSTGMPDTDDPVITTFPTTSTTDTDLPPVCDTPVMCGGVPCLDLTGNPICAPSFCWPMACADCPSSLCGEVDGVGSVCIIDNVVPCAPECEPVLCEDCPTEECINVGALSFCAVPNTTDLACKEELLKCDNLHNACTEDVHCAGGAPNCIDGLCRAACVEDVDCGLDSICASGVCTDTLENNVCKVTPHEPPPPPPCQPLGQCMNDLDCPAGASLCWDFITQAPVVEPDMGNCVAPCANSDECAETDMCATLGFCVNRAMEPTCSPE